MFELLIVVLFIWLMVKTIGLTFRLSWGLTKFVAAIVMALAVPVLVVCVVFAGGILLLVPLAMLAILAGIIKVCL